MTDEDVTMDSDNASAKEYGDKNEFVRSKLDHKVIKDNTIQHNLRRLLLGVVDSWNEWDDAWHPGTDRVTLISESALIAKHHIKLLELFKQSLRTSQFEPLITCQSFYPVTPRYRITELSISLQIFDAAVRLVYASHPHWRWSVPSKHL